MLNGGFFRVALNGVFAKTPRAPFFQGSGGIVLQKPQVMSRVLQFSAVGGAAVLGYATHPMPVANMPVANINADDGLEAAHNPTIVDPMLRGGGADAMVIRAELKANVEAAALANTEPLQPNWSNIFECPHALDVLFHTDATFAGLEKKEDIEAKCDGFFDRILSDEAASWTLEVACAEHGKYPANACYPRVLTDMFEFFGKTLGLSTHAAALSFEENHLFLLRNTFRVKDEEALYGMGSLALLIAITGGGKSIVLEMAEKVLVDPKVKEALKTAKNPAVRKMSDMDLVTSCRFNLEGLLEEAKKRNEPAGIRSIHEEIGDSMSKFGAAMDKDKLRPRDVITILNPTMQTGKRLKTVFSAIPNLKVNGTFGCQGAMAHFYLPCTKEGESSRWNVAISEDAPGLDLDRADKLVTKQGSFMVLKELLAVQAGKVLGEDDGTCRLDLDPKTRGLGCVLEKSAKNAVKRWVERVGQAKAKDDPSYGFLRGKLDAKYMSNLAKSWCVGECLLAFVNPAYKIQWKTNPLYGRQALWRSFLSESDRRALFVNNCRAIAANPYLKALAEGMSEEKVEEKVEETKQKAARPETEAQKLAYTLQAIYQHLSPAREMTLATCDTMKANDKNLRQIWKYQSNIRDSFSKLSTEHGLVTHIEKQNAAGQGTWEAIAPNAAIEGYLPQGRAGGHHVTPNIRCKADIAPEVQTFLSKVQGIIRYTKP